MKEAEKKKDQRVLSVKEKAEEKQQKTPWAHIIGKNKLSTRSLIQWVFIVKEEEAGKKKDMWVFSVKEADEKRKKTLYTHNN